MIFFLPLVAMVVGWLLHKLLISIFFNYQLPRLKEPLAQETARFVSRETDWKGIAALIAEDKNIQPLMPLFEEHLDVILRKKIKEKIPVLAALIGEKTIDKLKAAVMEEASVAIPRLIKGLGDNLQLHEKIEDVVRGKIMQMDFQRMKLMWKAALKKPLLYVELAGAISGLLIGLILLLFQYFLVI